MHLYHHQGRQGHMHLYHHQGHMHLYHLRMDVVVQQYAYASPPVKPVHAPTGLYGSLDPMVARYSSNEDMLVSIGKENSSDAGIAIPLHNP